MPSPQLQLYPPALQLQFPTPQLQFVPPAQFIPEPQLIPSRQGQLQFVAPSELQLQLQFPVPQLQLLKENKFFLFNTCFASEKDILVTYFCFIFTSFLIHMKGNETNYNCTCNCNYNHNDQGYPGQHSHKDNYNYNCHPFQVHRTAQMKTSVYVSIFALPHKNRCLLLVFFSSSTFIFT